MTDLSPEQVETLANRLSGGWDDADARDAAAFLAPTVAAMLAEAAAEAWDEGYAAGNAFGYEYAQDTYDGPSEDPTPNPYAAALATPTTEETGA